MRAARENRLDSGFFHKNRAAPSPRSTRPCFTRDADRPPQRLDERPISRAFRATGQERCRNTTGADISPAPAWRRIRIAVNAW
jgi:hypothetical protein